MPSVSPVQCSISSLCECRNGKLAHTPRSMWPHLSSPLVVHTPCPHGSPIRFHRCWASRQAGGFSSRQGSGPVATFYPCRLAWPKHPSGKTTPYDLRRTFTTLLTDFCVRPARVSEYMGWNPKRKKIGLYTETEFSMGFIKKIESAFSSLSTNSYTRSNTLRSGRCSDRADPC